MLQTKVVKKQLIADLDKNEAPTGFRFKVDRFITFDDGSEKIIEDVILATPEEIETHFGQAITAQAADIAADRIVRDGLVAQISEKEQLISLKDAEINRKADALRSKDVELSEKEAALAKAAADLEAARAEKAAAEEVALEAVKQ